MGKILLILIISLFIRPAFSCSCLELGEINNEQYNSYGLILTGKVISINDSLPLYKNFNVLVYSVYKGKINTDTISLFTFKGSGMCGISPKINDEWLFFVDNNSHSVTSCSRSKVMSGNSSYNYNEVISDLVFLIKKSILKKFFFID